MGSPGRRLSSSAAHDKHRSGAAVLMAVGVTILDSAGLADEVNHTTVVSDQWPVVGAGQYDCAGPLNTGEGLGQG